MRTDRAGCNPFLMSRGWCGSKEEKGAAARVKTYSEGHKGKESRGRGCKKEDQREEERVAKEKEGVVREEKKQRKDNDMGLDESDSSLDEGEEGSDLEDIVRRLDASSQAKKRGRTSNEVRGKLARHRHTLQQLQGCYT